MGTLIFIIIGLAVIVTASVVSYTAGRAKGFGDAYQYFFNGEKK